MYSRSSGLVGAQESTLQSLRQRIIWHGTTGVELHFVNKFVKDPQGASYFCYEMSYLYSISIGYTKNIIKLKIMMILC